MGVVLLFHDASVGLRAASFLARSSQIATILYDVVGVVLLLHDAFRRLRAAFFLAKSL